MNRSGLRKLVGRPVRIRPAVWRVFYGEELPSIDDKWLVGAAGASGGAISLSLLGGAHVLNLECDSVYEFFEPDLLVLRAQLTLTRWEARLDPLPYSVGAAARYAMPDWPSWGDWVKAGAPPKKPRRRRLATSMRSA